MNMANDGGSSDSKSKVRRRLPILIIPGFMSSGLYVKESSTKESWVGERIWINLVALGFEAAHMKRRHDTLDVIDVIDGNDSDDNEGDGEGGFNVDIDSDSDKEGDDEEKGNVRMQAPEEKEEVEDEENPHLDLGPGADQANNSKANAARTSTSTEATSRDKVLRNNWLHHMALADDMISERTGIQVRNIEGLGGVDYLSPGALTSLLSYVFGPVIQALQQAGYEPGKDLDAAPYDWRLPPSALETRDRYYTRTIRKIEEMYAENDDTPLVLICHSMGTRIAHHFLNFAKNVKGQD
jgi:hypothetical protein